VDNLVERVRRKVHNKTFRSWHDLMAGLVYMGHCMSVYAIKETFHIFRLQILVYGILCSMFPVVVLEICKIYTFKV